MTTIITKSEQLLPVRDWPNMLITADQWFNGPSGVQYKAVYGPVDIVSAKTLLSFEPKHGTNWYIAVGYPGNQLIIAGCQVHYAMMCPDKPPVMDNILDLSVDKR